MAELIWIFLSLCLRGDEVKTFCWSFLVKQVICKMELFESALTNYTVQTMDHRFEPMF